MDAQRLSSDPLPAGVFDSADPCPLCGHSLPDNAHDGDDGTACPSCDGAAEGGAYAPCQSYSDGLVLVAGVLYDTETGDEA